jgi:UDP-glucuronate 4-epimerase
MKTLISGSSGFVGIALTEELLEHGEDVVGLDIVAPPPAATHSFKLKKGRFSFAQGSALDSALLEEAIKRHDVRRLVALAAITAGSNREKDDPYTITNVTIGGTVTAIAAAAKHGIKRIVYVSSGAVYGASGETAGILIEDEVAQRPEGLYGISKQAAEAAALRLGKLYDIDVVAGRLGTCFGPWERETGVRDTLSALLQVLRIAQHGGEAILPRNSMRDWLYVRDGAAGLHALLRTPQLPHAISNVAAGFEFSTDQWCALLKEKFPRFRWHNAVRGEQPNINLYNTYDRASMDISRLRRDTNFLPKYDLPLAFEDFEAWQKINPTA